MLLGLFISLSGFSLSESGEISVVHLALLTVTRFLILLFITLYEVVLTFVSVDEILK